MRYGYFSEKMGSKYEKPEFFTVRKSQTATNFMIWAEIVTVESGLSDTGISDNPGCPT